MVIKNLQLTNFRNYPKLDLTFDQKPTIFIGPNGAGKSNILESIYVLATTKSPRVESETELIKEGEQFCSIKGLLEAEDSELFVTLVQEGQDYCKKRVFLNGVARRAVDFIGNLPAVIFWPSDINMVTGSPSLRRWHLDLSLAQIDPGYKRSLTLYEQVLTARNKVLKRIREGQGRIDELTYWTDELIKYGEVIAKGRKIFFEFINRYKSPLGNFRFEYHPNELSYERIETYNGREVASASTLVGPHRDDFSFYLSSRDMSRFGSRGEQRMATLAFKLGVLEYMSKVLSRRPVLLLDDVFSELDAKHRAQVSEIAKLQQTIIATVELENIPQEFLDSSRILQVENGKITS